MILRDNESKGDSEPKGCEPKEHEVIRIARKEYLHSAYMYHYFSAQVQGVTDEINGWLQCFKRILFNKFFRLSTTLIYLNL